MIVILFYLVTLNPDMPAEPVALTGPLEKEVCMKFEKEIAEPYTFCQEFKIKPLPKVKQ